MIVEDEAAVRGLVRTSLERYGYQVRTAGSGVEALKEWSDRLNEIDLLITDVVMPDGVSGWELARRMQAKKPLLKTLYMRGYSTSMSAMDSVPATLNRNEFLQKPFKPKWLAELVRACLEEPPQSPCAFPPTGPARLGSG